MQKSKQDEDNYKRESSKKLDCIDGSNLNENREPILFRFALE